MWSAYSKQSLIQKYANIWKHGIAYNVLPLLNTIQYLKNRHSVSNSRCYILLEHLTIQFISHGGFLGTLLSRVFIFNQPTFYISSNNWVHMSYNRHLQFLNDKNPNVVFCLLTHDASPLQKLFSSDCVHLLSSVHSSNHSITERQNWYGSSSEWEIVSQRKLFFAHIIPTWHYDSEVSKSLLNFIKVYIAQFQLRCTTQHQLSKSDSVYVGHTSLDCHFLIFTSQPTIPVQITEGMDILEKEKL